MSDLLRDVVEEHGTPCFVYELDEIAARIGALRGAFGDGFRISYAVKANPQPALLRWLRDRVERLDVSSGGELRLALESDWEPERLSFTGPAKTESELRLAAERGIGEVVLESVEEARALDRIAASLGSAQQPVLARLAPRRIPRGFGVNMAGKPTPFGIDEEDAGGALAEIASLPHLALRGFHVYAGTQCLDAESLVEHFETMAGLFERFAESCEDGARTLVFGSGFGIPYHEGDAPFDLDAVAAGVRPVLARLRGIPGLDRAAPVLELGRWLVGEAGTYFVRVLRVKRSRGADIALCDGGMHHQLAAAGHLGSVIPRNYAIFALAGDDTPEGASREYDLAGPLCTSIDMLGRRVRLPELAPGDVLGVRASGAYGLTASPTHFLAHDPPKEIFVETRRGRIIVTDVSAESPVRRAR